MSDSNKRFLNNKIDSLHDIMFDSPGYFYIKDIEGRYLYLNKNLIEVGGGSKMSEFLGKNDYNYDFPWQKYGRMYRANDSIARSNQNPIHAIEMAETHKGRAYIISSTKKTFYSEGKIIGMCGTSIEIPASHSFATPDFSEHSLFFDVKKEAITNLTTKQRHVAYYVLQGLTTREISEKLLLSKRTVEHHIDSIKDANEYNSIRELLLYMRII